MFKVFLFLGLALLAAVLGIIFNIVLKKKGKRRGLLKVATVILTIIFLFMALVAFIFRNAGITEYDDLEKFQEASYMIWDCPDNAENIRMAINNQLISKTMLISFNLDDDEMEEFIDEVILVKYKHNDPSVTDSQATDNEYYDILVKDIDDVNVNYSLDDFPHSLAFDAVIDDSVEEYTVLYYYPVNSGHSGDAILYNKETNTVLEYHLSNAR